MLIKSHSLKNPSFNEAEGNAYISTSTEREIPTLFGSEEGSGSKGMEVKYISLLYPEKQ